MVHVTGVAFDHLVFFSIFQSRRRGTQPAAKNRTRETNPHPVGWRLNRPLEEYAQNGDFLFGAKNWKYV